ncbi:MAG: peptidylprolyl isomerase [bacterium]|nr:peptidylprolyl isomerase [bacterium]
MAQMQGLRTKIVTNYGEIELQFFPEKAPVHCFAFIIRAESGFYDGQLFHRVVPGFMIQGGDPNSTDEDPYNDGRGKPIVAIPHEFNDLEHTRGRLSMARVANVAIGAGSQFFILQKDTHRLDGNYTVFGEVVSGIDVVDQIAGVETEEKDPELKNRPVKPVVIQKMIVYTRP